jgi:hypothetical protein
MPTRREVYPLLERAEASAAEAYISVLYQEQPAWVDAAREELSRRGGSWGPEDLADLLRAGVAQLPESWGEWQWPAINWQATPY